MLKKLFISILVIFVIFTCSTITIKEEKLDYKIKNFNFNIHKTLLEEEKKQSNNIIGNIKINKLSIDKPLYKIGSEENNIEKNITILEGSIEPQNENSIMFIAAHSGTGKVAFFKDLDKLKIGDEIELTYNNTSYIYEVNNYWETAKDGDIEILKDITKQLVLTTCSPNDKEKQLIINCTIKEP